MWFYLQLSGEKKQVALQMRIARYIYHIKLLSHQVKRVQILIYFLIMPVKWNSKTKMVHHLSNGTLLNRHLKHGKIAAGAVPVIIPGSAMQSLASAAAFNGPAMISFLMVQITFILMEFSILPLNIAKPLAMIWKQAALPISRNIN